MDKPTAVPAGTTTRSLGRRGYVVYRQDGTVLHYAPPLESRCPQCGAKHTDGANVCHVCAQYAGQP